MFTTVDIIHMCSGQLNVNQITIERKIHVDKLPILKKKTFLFFNVFHFETNRCLLETSEEVVMLQLKDVFVAIFLDQHPGLLR